MVTILTAIIFTFTLQDEVERVVICTREQIKEQKTKTNNKVPLYNERDFF